MRYMQGLLERSSKLFRGGHVGGDHELLDQAVAVVSLGAGTISGDRLRPASQQDLALGQIELQGAARRAGPGEGLKGAEQGADHAVDERRGGLVGAAVEGGLGLAIGQARRRAHEAAQEAVPERPSVAVDPEMHRQAGALFGRLQRAPAVAQRFRQHGNDPVGEIGRVARS